MINTLSFNFIRPLHEKGRSYSTLPKITSFIATKRIIGSFLFCPSFFWCAVVGQKKNNSVIIYILFFQFRYYLTNTIIHGTNHTSIHFSQWIFNIWESVNIFFWCLNWTMRSIVR